MLAGRLEAFQRIAPLIEPRMNRQCRFRIRELDGLSKSDDLHPLGVARSRRPSQFDQVERAAGARTQVSKRRRLLFSRSVREI
jgi:hypothetical protein